MINIHTISLYEYFQLLKDKQIQSITFLEDYFQIHFVHGYISCISETFVNTKEGSFLYPSKEANWQIFQLMKKDVISVEEMGSAIVLKVDGGVEITVNTSLGPSGDTFHITVEDYQRLLF